MALFRFKICLEQYINQMSNINKIILKSGVELNTVTLI